MLIFKEIDSTLLACIEMLVNTPDIKTTPIDSFLFVLLFCCEAHQIFRLMPAKKVRGVAGP